MFAHLAPRGVSINRRVINQIIIIISAIKLFLNVIIKFTCSMQ